VVAIYICIYTYKYIYIHTYNRILTAKEKNAMRLDGDVYDELRDRYAMAEEVSTYV
jgi:hypothetical protein